MNMTSLILAGAITFAGVGAPMLPPDNTDPTSEGAITIDGQIQTNPQDAVTTPATIEPSPAPIPEPVPVPVPVPEPAPQPAPVPQLTPSQLNYSVVLGEFTTYFSLSNTNRCTNLKLATEAINGYIVEGGGQFSFNGVVGRRTSARGYKSAPVISGGKMTTGIGGGICQISTNVFNAALLSNMTITERWQHSLKSSYVEAGRDASVSYPSADFKFVNPYNQPVKISATYNPNGSATVAILGPDGSSAPWVQLKVTKTSSKYKLTRTYGGAVNYTAYSSYK